MLYNYFERIFFFSLSFSFIIFFWLKTNVLIEYYKLFFIRGIKTIDNYIDQNKAGFVEIFPEYLKKKDNFFFNLITCNICLSVWAGIISSPFTHYSFLVVGFFTFLFYSLLSYAHEKA